MPHSSLAAQIAANSRWSKEDPTEQGRIMRAGLERRFLDEVDPNRELSEPERARRIECAKRAYYQRLALASAKARRERSQTRRNTVGGGEAA